MTIEVFPDSPTLGMSPRISFSHDLSQTDVVPVEQYIRSSSPSAIDFDFCVFRESFDQESASADELFFDGKILPIEIKKRLSPPKKAAALPPPSPPLPPPPRPQIQESKKIPISESEEKQSFTKSSSSSFWGFKRSSSLNCGSGYGRTLCPLPLLSRSNSTGSANSANKRSSVSNNQKQNLLKNSAPNSSVKQTAYSSKPPLKKNPSHGFHGNGVKFNPVLNVPSANLFRLGSIFSSSKDKSRKK
ncbi:hypothetical protein ACJIZ3_002288 [Penstemon smallii]|uniref:Uncharacterized protein n=1 Tax=Penstemon smallii TaxID=265156 RepID=A0ABD3U8Y2_9LAMI